MVSLYAGGAPSQLVRATGSAGPVQGLLAFGSPLAGARRSTALPFSIRQQGGDGLAQLTLPGFPPTPASVDVDAPILLVRFAKMGIR